MITTERPCVSPDARFCKSAAARILGISRNTLIKYTEAKAIKVSYRKFDKRAYYTGASILSFWDSTC